MALSGQVVLSQQGVLVWQVVLSRQAVLSQHVDDHLPKGLKELWVGAGGSSRRATLTGQVVLSEHGATMAYPFEVAAGHKYSGYHPTPCKSFSARTLPAAGVEARTAPTCASHLHCQSTAAALHSCSAAPAPRGTAPEEVQQHGSSGLLIDQNDLFGLSWDMHQQLKRLMPVPRGIIQVLQNKHCPWPLHPLSL